ncbi:hypothetical protein SAMN05421796_106186 [Chryseobacterium piscicola]|uniref:Uncharacterized protein n=1 Tax=Chryseobacterium piscicola TaxID=551459 RepID=A0A1N7N3Z4_9FLAO|nr:hypothetical protein [Chryseobacterium piscicola]PQA89828.1 hypothetical protein B0A70_15515 [Chryseobacterium piscicola]SIS93097.1 hypothetical protein SAMN05421796_106186 [Chryseobacterium piscicola]
MIYTVPTKKGLGIEFWGTDDDLTYLYDAISKFWNNDNFSLIFGYENKANVISGFAHEIRKASYGSRLKRNSSHYTPAEIPYLGFQISWPHILFCMSCLNSNRQWVETTKYDVSIFLQLKYWIEKSMYEYDSVGAEKLSFFLNGAIHGNNEYIYQYMRNINMRFFQMKGGKMSFRKLSDLMKTASNFTNEYQELLDFLKFEAQKYNCKIDDLDIDDDNEIYEIEW